MADRRKHWAEALAIAGLMATARLISDALFPAHPRWWLTPAVAFIASILTSTIWLASYRVRPKGRAKEAKCGCPVKPFVFHLDRCRADDERDADVHL